MADTDSAAFQEGLKAAKEGKGKSYNPYVTPPGAPVNFREKLWNKGWDAGRQAGNSSRWL